MSRLLQVAGKTLKEAYRQPRTLSISMGLPVAFMVIFGLAFGAEDGPSTFDVAVVDEDGGAFATRYLDGLRDLRHEDGTPLLRLTVAASQADGRRQAEMRDVDAFLVIPDGFTEGLTPTPPPPSNGLPVGQAQQRPGPPSGTNVSLWGDPSFADHAAVARIVDAYTQAFAARATNAEPAVTVERQVLVSQELTGFDFIAPGLMVFAVLNLIPQAAGALAREVELGTIDRLRQSPTGAFTVLGGVALAQLVLASVSMGLMLVAARVMGFHNQGSYLAAYGIILASAAAIVGIAMLVASFARTQQEAANFGILIAVPGSFLSGAFFAVPGVHLATIGGRDLGLYDILPTTHATEALRDVLTFGRPLDTVAWQVGALLVLATVSLLAGILLYRRNRLGPERL